MTIINNIIWPVCGNGNVPVSYNIIYHDFGEYVKFEGDFSFDSDALPIERLMLVNGIMYHILLKQYYKYDSTTIAPDPLDHRLKCMCITNEPINPIYTIILHYEIIATIEDTDMQKNTMDIINNQADEENTRIKEAQQERLEREEEDRIYEAHLYRNSY